MIELLLSLFQADFFSYIIVAILTLWAASLVKIMTGSSILCWLFMPAFALGALAMVSYCKLEHIIFVDDKDSNVIVTSSVGVLAGFLVMLLLTKSLFLFMDRRKPILTVEGRDRTQARVR